MPKKQIITTPIKERIIAEFNTGGKKQITIANEFDVSRDFVSKLIKVVFFIKKEKY